jgi:hypothetical protein
MRAAVGTNISKAHIQIHIHTHKNKYSIGQQTIHCYSLCVLVVALDNMLVLGDLSPRQANSSNQPGLGQI